MEEAVGIAGDGQFVLMGGEIVADVGEHAFRDIVESCRMVIVLGPRHWQEVEDQIVDEERGEDDKRGALKLLVAAEEIEEGDGGYQREIARVAHQQQFVDEIVGHGFTEEQGRLTAEDLLLPRGKDMVEIGEDAVHQVGVGIPPGKQAHVEADATEEGETTGPHPVDTPQGQYHDQDLESAPEHRPGIDDLRIGEQDH